MISTKEYIKFFDYDRDILIKTGIYSIEFIDKPDKFYVGSAFPKEKDKKLISQGFYTRWSKHLHSLKNNYHHSKYLQNTFNLEKKYFQAKIFYIRNFTF